MEPRRWHAGVFLFPPTISRSEELPSLNSRDLFFGRTISGTLPFFFGNTGLNRFDAPDGSYQVLYAGLDPFCAFIETFGRAAGTRIVTTAALKSRALTELKPRRVARLIDLTSSGALVRIGADSNLFSGPHSSSQAWSKALHEHPLKADGLRYPSRLDPNRHAVAIFGDRRLNLTEIERRGRYDTGAQRRLMAEIAEHYQIELIDNQYAASRKPAARVVQPRLIDE